MFKRLLCGIAAIALLACCAGCKEELPGAAPDEAAGENLEHSMDSAEAGYRRTVLYYVSDEEVGS